MKRTPINKLLDEQVNWTACSGRVIELTPGIPHATHEGVWDSPFGQLRVYRLSDGQNIINAEDLEATEFWKAAMGFRE